MAAHTDGNLVNAWGLTAGPTTPWWVSDNGTDKSTLYNGDGTASLAGSGRRGRADGNRLQPDGRLRAADGRQGAVPVRQRGRRDPRLERSPGHDRGRRQGPLQRRSDLQGPHDRGYQGRAAAVRGRLPQRADRRPGRELRPEARRLPRSVPAAALRAVQRPGDRRPRVRRIREAGCEGRGRDRRPRPRFRRRLRPQGPPARAGRFTRPPQRAVGARACSEELRSLRGRPSRGELRKRQDPRVRGALEGALRLAQASLAPPWPGDHFKPLQVPRHAAGRLWKADRDRRALGTPVRERLRGRIVQHAVLHGGPERREPRALRNDHAQK